MATLTKKVGSRQHVILDRLQLNSGNAPQIGYLNKSLGSVTGDLTWPLSADEYNNLVIRFTGAGDAPGRTVTIIVPDDAGAYWTMMNDTASQDVTIVVKTSAQSAGTAVEVPIGGSVDCFIAYDGANYTVQRNNTASVSAPVDATYLTLTNNGTLTNERALTFFGSDFDTFDAGAGSTYTVSINGIVSKYAANITALRNLDTSTYTEGTIAFVNTLNATYEYSNNATDASLTHDALNYEVVTSLSGGSPANARWIRKDSSDLRWAKESTWYIDGTSGDNENTGLTSGAPLKTHEEFSKRVGQYSLQQNTTINMVTDGYTGTQVAVNPSWTKDGYSIIYRGVPTIDQSYTLNGVNAIDRANNSAYSVTQAGTWAAGDLSRVCKVGTDGYAVSMFGVDTSTLTITFVHQYNDSGVGDASGNVVLAGSESFDTLTLPAVNFRPITARNVYIELIKFTQDIQVAGGYAEINRCEAVGAISDPSIYAIDGGLVTSNNCYVGTYTSSRNGFIGAFNSLASLGIVVSGQSEFVQGVSSSGDGYSDLFFDMSNGGVLWDYDNLSTIGRSSSKFTNVGLMNATNIVAASAMFNLTAGGNTYIKSSVYADINTALDGYLCSVSGVGSMFIAGSSATLTAKFDATTAGNYVDFIHNGVVRDGTQDLPITNLVKFNGVISELSS